MSERRDIRAVREQMEFEVVDNGVIELPTSTPGVLEFDSPAELNPDAFESALDEHDFVALDTFVESSDDGFYYKTKILTDHCKDCVVKVWEHQVCIFPKEELLDTYELSRVIHAIEDAFGAGLSHPKE